MSKASAEGSGLRLDKWLWAARFYRSRNLAAAAVQGGKVLVNNARVKPSRLVHPGDLLNLNKAGIDWELVILHLEARRRSASEAGKLYQETEAGQAKRLETASRSRAEALTAPRTEGKPNRRQRRQWTRLNRDQAED